MFCVVRIVVAWKIASFLNYILDGKFNANSTVTNRKTSARVCQRNDSMVGDTAKKQHTFSKNSGYNYCRVCECITASSTDEQLV